MMNLKPNGISNRTPEVSLGRLQKELEEEGPRTST